jgi:hypothetical protein
MCFDYGSRPPVLPTDLVCSSIAGGAAAELLTLESDDGTAFSTALAQAPESDESGVVIIPDVRGLYPFYIELAERFAEAGHHAIAFDYYGRTAGLGPRDDQFDYGPHREQVNWTRRSTTSPRRRRSSADARGPVRRSPSGSASADRCRSWPGPVPTWISPGWWVSMASSTPPDSTAAES